MTNHTEHVPRVQYTEAPRAPTMARDRSAPSAHHRLRHSQRCCRQWQFGNWNTFDGRMTRVGPRHVRSHHRDFAGAHPHHYHDWIPAEQRARVVRTNRPGQHRLKHCPPLGDRTRRNSCRRRPDLPEPQPASRAIPSCRRPVHLARYLHRSRVRDRPPILVELARLKALGQEATLGTATTLHGSSHDSHDDAWLPASAVKQRHA
jgi:hypothetical protein